MYESLRMLALNLELSVHNPAIFPLTALHAYLGGGGAATRVLPCWTLYWDHEADGMMPW